MTREQFIADLKEFIYAHPFYSDNDHDEFTHPETKENSVEIYDDKCRENDSVCIVIQS